MTEVIWKAGFGSPRLGPRGCVWLDQVSPTLMEGLLISPLHHYSRPVSPCDPPSPDHHSLRPDCISLAGPGLWSGNPRLEDMVLHTLRWHGAV